MPDLDPLVIINMHASQLRALVGYIENVAAHTPAFPLEWQGYEKLAAALERHERGAGK